MKQYEMMELSFSGREPVGSKVEVDLRATFTCDSEISEVIGFYAGDGIYKIRFYPKKVGLYRWSVTGIVTCEGEEKCISNSEAHGMVKANGLHFQHEDGTKYLPFGTTIYAMVHQEKDLIDLTMKTLSEAPFNKVRFCVFPKNYDFNHNEPELFAFEKTDGKWDVHRPCYKFWDALEERLIQLNKMDIEGDLIIFHPYDRWGFAKFTKDECMVYLDYLTRRLAAFPNLWWSLANEFDLMDNFKKEWWAEFASFITKQDPYGHLLSNHNCFGYWDFSNQDTTHCSIQDELMWDVDVLQERYGKPVIFDEFCYEGTIKYHWGSLSPFEMVNRFWTTSTCGGYCTHGETYVTEDEILWWSRGGLLRGESPKRIAFLKEIMYSLPQPITYFKKNNDYTFQTIEGIRRGEFPSIYPDSHTQRLLTIPAERLKHFIDRNKEIVGHCKEDAYLKYFGRNCFYKGELELPETGCYSIEIIDVWEMTRTPVLNDVNGKVTVKLPEKEGIAILALKDVWE